MTILIKIFIVILLSVTLTSCSLFLGGIVALDNSANKGGKEINIEKIIKLQEGKKIILELNDSTKISGKYKGYREFDREKQLNIITILDENNELKSVNSSEVNKYIYIDEGGKVWVAAAIGAVFDAVVIYGIINGPKIGGTGRVF